MDFMTYIIPELAICIPALYFLGYVLKTSKRFEDELIPSVIVIVGIVVAFLFILSTMPLTTTQEWGSAIFSAITQGVCIAGATVLTNQIIKQANKFGELDKEDDKFWEKLEHMVDTYEPPHSITETAEVSMGNSDGSLESGKNTYAKIDYDDDLK